MMEMFWKWIMVMPPCKCNNATELYTFKNGLKGTFYIIYIIKIIILSKRSQTHTLKAGPSYLVGDLCV